jgi:hypothetical protein
MINFRQKKKNKLKFMIKYILTDNKQNINKLKQTIHN